ncbi:MAG: twin-arginine translocase subunit TatB [Rhodospirillaceae bacterium]|nr:twin-arginine translocase subunit TatB [Rhodospirillaceae bacterium]
MFDLAWSELFVIGLVAVLVLGPKELPTAMRTLAKAIRKVRNLGSEFQGHFNEMLREAELDEVRKQVQKFSQTSLVDHVTNYIDPQGEVAKEVNSALEDPDKKTQPADQGVATPGAPDVAAVEPPAEAVPAEQKPPAAT